MLYSESSPLIYIAKFSVTNPLKAPKVRVRLDPRMCLFSKSDPDSTDNASEVRSADTKSMSPVSSEPTGIRKLFSTRYTGRSSNNYPSRANKRRMIPVHSRPPARKAKVKTVPLSQPPSFASGNLEQQEERTQGPNVVTGEQKNDFLTTDTAYLPDYQSLAPSSSRKIDVPLWKLKTYSYSYRMEGTEDINDSVFEQRHKKCEKAEIQRKKWDIQRLREQNATEKQKKKLIRKSKNSVQRKSQSFYPDPRNIEYIEVTQDLPVLAFGHPIPLFHSCEFSLPWCCEGSSSTYSLDVPKAKRGRPSVT